MTTSRIMPNKQAPFFASPALMLLFALPPKVQRTIGKGVFVGALAVATHKALKDEKVQEAISEAAEKNPAFGKFVGLASQAKRTASKTLSAVVIGVGEQIRRRRA